MSSVGPPNSKGGREKKANLGIEAETGLMRPQPKEPWKALESEEARKKFSPGASRRNPCLYLDFSPARLTLDYWPPEL